MRPKRKCGVTKRSNTSAAAEPKNVEEELRLQEENNRLKKCLQDMGKIITEGLSGVSLLTRAASILPDSSTEARSFIQVIPENSNAYLQEFPPYAPHNGGRWIQLLPGGAIRKGPIHPPPAPVVAKQEKSSEGLASVVPEMNKGPTKNSDSDEPAVVPQGGPSTPFFQAPPTRVRLNTSKDERQRQLLGLQMLSKADKIQELKGKKRKLEDVLI